MNNSFSCAYLDCFSGISGDMLLGALLHAGLKKDTLLEELHKIEGIDFQITVKNLLCSGISCTQVSVNSPSSQTFRHLSDIISILSESNLPQTIIHKAKQIFTRLAQAEANVHNVKLEEIHFHEVGAVDTIVDIVGALIGLHHLGINDLICSPLPIGQGLVSCAHGNLPLPAPAVCELLQGVPVYGVNQSKELITPTGAVLAVELAHTFGKFPSMTIKSTGYGKGNHRLNGGQPNLLRLVIGQTIAVNEHTTVEIIETNLDDWNSEGFPYLCDLLFNNGALDVSITPLIMKKGRPGQLLRVITAPAHSLALKQIILSETTAIGLRFRKEERMTLARQPVKVSTSWGNITAKKVETPKGNVIYPEYEACRQIAKRYDIPLAKVYNTVSNADIVLPESEQPDLL